MRYILILQVRQWAVSSIALTTSPVLFTSKSECLKAGKEWEAMTPSSQFIHESFCLEVFDD